MSEPIISPWLIYLADVCNCVCIVSSMTAIFLAGLVAYYGVNLSDAYDKEVIHEIYPLFKKAICGFVVAVTVATFVPSKDTVISMSIANVVTKENINLTRDEVLSFITDAKNILDGKKDKKQ